METLREVAVISALSIVLALRKYKTEILGLVHLHGIASSVARAG